MFKEFDFLLKQGQDLILCLANRADLHAELSGHIGTFAALFRYFHICGPGARLDTGAYVVFGLLQQFQVVFPRQPCFQIHACLYLFHKTIAVWRRQGRRCLSFRSAIKRCVTVFR